MLVVHLFSGGDEFATGGVAILRFLSPLVHSSQCNHLRSKKSLRSNGWVPPRSTSCYLKFGFPLPAQVVIASTLYYSEWSVL